MKSLRRLSMLLALQLLAGLLLFEGVLRAVAPFSAGVRSWIDAPQDDHDFAHADSLPELLDMSALGDQPCRDVGGFVTNSRGLRTPEYSRVKPAGTFRVLALGDSFTFASGGVPWPDLWTTRLAHELQDGRRDTVELINLGMPGIGPSFERRMWQLEGRGLGADLVVLQFYVGNDFRDEAWVPDAGFFSRIGRRSAVLRALRNLLRGREEHMEGQQAQHSVTVDASATAPLPRGGYEVPGYRHVFDARRPLFTSGQLLDVESRDVRACDRSQTSVFDSMCARVEPVLVDLAADIEASGAQLLVVVVPDRVQVNASDRAAVVAALHRPDADFDWDAPQRWLDAMLARHGISCLDLLPAFREAAGCAPSCAGSPDMRSVGTEAAGEHTPGAQASGGAAAAGTASGGDVPAGESAAALYAGDDTHWSPAGNALAAELIAQRLRETSLHPVDTGAIRH